MIKIINRYMALIIVIISTVGFFFPKTTVWAVRYIPTMLGIIMFGMGLTIEKKDFFTVVRNPFYVCVGVVLQFIVMPALAYFLCLIFKLEKEQAIGVILVGCVSGGTASNVITYLARGNVALSVSMTTVSTFLGVFISPMLIYFLVGKWVSVSILAMFITITKIIIIPITLGIVIKSFFHSFTDKYIKVMPVFSIFVIALTCSAIVAQNSKDLLSSGFTILLVVIIHNVAGLLIAYVISKLLNIPESERRAITIEVGMQNSGLAASIAVANFSPVSAVAGAIFSIWHNISGSIMAAYFRNKDRNNKGVQRNK